MLDHRYVIVLCVNCLFALSNIESVAAKRQIPLPVQAPVLVLAQITVPTYLNPKPNLLNLPTKPEEVRIKGTQPITLAQALELARRNNLALQTALLTVESSQANFRIVQADMYPTLSLNTDLSRALSASDRLFAKQSTTNKQAQLLSTQNFFSNQNQPTTTFISQDQSTTTFSGSLQLTYGLYNHKKGASSRQLAKQQILIDKLDLERQTAEIYVNVTNAYYDLQSADEQVRIQQAAVANGEASLRDAQALERAGVGTRFETLQAQVNLANEQQQLVSALSQQQISRRQLAQLLNLAQSVDISAADPVQLAGLWNYTLECSIVLAFQNRPELRQYILQRNIAELQRKIQLSNLKPDVELVTSYNVENLFNDRVSTTDGYSTGVNANVNLFDGGAVRASAAQQRINIRIAESQFVTQRNQVRFQVEQYYSQLQSNLQNVQTATVAVTEAREALRLARLRFQAGVGTQTDVITQETSLTSAEGNKVTAILNYNRAFANLQRAVIPNPPFTPPKKRKTE